MSRVMLTRFLTPEGEPLTDWQTPLKRSSPIDRVDLLFNVARKCMTYLSTPASLLVSICFYPIDAFFHVRLDPMFIPAVFFRDQFTTRPTIS